MLFWLRTVHVSGTISKVDCYVTSKISLFVLARVFYEKKRATVAQMPLQKRLPRPTKSQVYG